MPITSLNYAAPIRRGERPPEPDFELFEAALACAEEGKSLASVTKVFEHLFPGRHIPDLAAAPFSFTQGSSRVTVRVDHGDLLITVPLVKLSTGGNAVAALRYVLSRISGAGQLHQPRLRGDVLILEFRDKLTRMHPTKLVEVLRRMPIEADNNDDWLVGQFSAMPLARAPVEAVNDDEFARCAAIWSEHWHDLEELQRESHKKRSMFFLDEATAFAVSRIRFALPLSGFLGAQLSEYAATFCNGEVDPLKRESTLGRCIKDMKAVPADTLRDNLGHVEHAFSPLDEGTPAMLSGYFEIGEDSFIDMIHQLRKSGRNAEAALGMFGTYYFLLAHYYWPEAVEERMKQGLELASGKSWREMTALLFDHARALEADFGGEAADNDDVEEDFEDEELEDEELEDEEEDA